MLLGIISSSIYHYASLSSFIIKDSILHLFVLLLLLSALQIVMVGTRVYVGGLSYRVGERDLDRFFRSYGRLRDIVIKNGFGFVVSDGRSTRGIFRFIIFTYLFIHLFYNGLTDECFLCLHLSWISFCVYIRSDMLFLFIFSLALLSQVRLIELLFLGVFWDYWLFHYISLFLFSLI